MIAVALRHVVALALPPRCAGCGTTVAADHRFCADCWGRLHFLGPPWCAGCNTPFGWDRGEGALCGQCLLAPPLHAGVRAAVGYGDIARTLALRLKYGRRIGLARTMATLMQRLMPPDVDGLVPVPLHRGRLWSRGFNQSALIAQALAARCGVPVDGAALRRTRATPPLRGMGPRGRAAAVRDAFCVPDPGRVAGRALVLIDDVYTTGATTDACVAALRRAGAASVHILCWARVLPDAGD